MTTHSRHNHSFIWATITLAVLFAAISMDAGAQSHHSRNAAHWYQRAMEHFRELPEAQRVLLIEWTSTPGAAITPEVRSALARAQPAFEDLRRGAAQDYCDYQLDYSQGFGLLLPHLNDMRGIARLAQADAMVRLQQGDASGAAARIADLYRMSGHIGQDHVIISSLVGQAVFAVADAAAQSALDQGALNAADASRLLAAVEELGVNDPYSVVEAVAKEQEIGLATMEQYRDEERRAEFGQVMGAVDATEELVMMDSAAYDEALQQYDALMTRLVEAFDMPPDEAAAALSEIEGEIERSEHGPIAGVIMPAMGKVLKRKVDTEQRIAERIELYRELATGAARPAEKANAAIWYLRAIELLANIDGEELEALRSFAADTFQVLPASVSQTLREGQPIVEILREASAMRRCDFTFAHVDLRERPLLVQPHHAGMHDLARLLRADAVRLLRGQAANAGGESPAGADVSAAVDRLNMSFIMSAHLSAGDAHLVGSRIAHAMFNDALALTHSALDSGLLNDDHRLALLEAADRVGRSDPFGYGAALEVMRSELAGQFNHRVIETSAQRAELERQAEIIRGYTADQTLVVYAALNTLASSSRDDGDDLDAGAADIGATAKSQAHVQDAALRRLADVLNLAELERARDAAVELAPMIASDHWDFFSADEAGGRGHLPRIADVAGFMRRARGDLRQALVLLKPSAGGPPAPADDAE